MHLFPGKNFFLSLLIVGNPVLLLAQNSKDSIHPKILEIQICSVIPKIIIRRRCRLLTRSNSFAVGLVFQLAFPQYLSSLRRY